MAINESLNPDFLSRCPVQDGFRQRGAEMTRIEVLTDTAFAFAVTMLVISLNDLPRTWQELLDGVRQLPALIASFAQIMMFWYGHVKWSRRFGLEDSTTICLSAVLIFVTLVFVYFLRLLFSSAFAWATDGYLPSELEIESVAHVRWLFILYGAGFLLLSGVLGLLNAHALRLRAKLSLDALEIHETRVEILASIVLAATASISILLAIVLDGPWLSLAGIVYATLGITLTILGIEGARRRPAAVPADGNAAGAIAH
ncbi:MAG TPA: TMEM175 family protein [Gammaproteobacteria bacterium]